MVVGIHLLVLYREKCENSSIPFIVIHFVLIYETKQSFIEYLFCSML